MWILYIPRPRDEAGLANTDGRSLWDEAASWLEHKQPATLSPEHILCHPAPLPRGGAGLTAKKTVYVLAGESVQGWDAAGWPGTSNPLTYERMADRVIGAGLRREFPGALKVYCSHGAENKGASESFVQRFAGEMVRRGYDRCAIYGYVGAVTLHYVNSGSESPQDRAMFTRAPELLDQGWHRYSTHGQHPFYAKRAKDAKVQFLPSPPGSAPA